MQFSKSRKINSYIGSSAVFDCQELVYAKKFNTQGVSMKKIIMATVLGLSMSAFAQQAKELDRDAVSIANLIKNSTVKNCIVKLESDKKASLSIGKIIKTKAEDLTKYEISGVLLQGGDVAIGSATLIIEGSYQDWGFAYTCSSK